MGAVHQHLGDGPRKRNEPLTLAEFPHEAQLQLPASSFPVGPQAPGFRRRGVHPGNPLLLHRRFRRAATHRRQPPAQRYSLCGCRPLLLAVLLAVLPTGFQGLQPHLERTTRPGVSDGDDSRRVPERRSAATGWQRRADAEMTES